MPERPRRPARAQQGPGVGHEGGHVDAAGPDPRTRSGEHGTGRHGIRLQSQARAADVDGDDRRLTPTDHFAIPAVKPATICLVATRKSTMSGTVVMTSPAKTAE